MVNDLPSSDVGTQAPLLCMECRTCGKPMYFARPRSYCDQRCYDNRPRRTLAQDIVRVLGGYMEVSQRLDVPSKSVRAWGLNGIPRRYHEQIIALGREIKLPKTAITLAKLQSTTEFGRLYRKEQRDRRKTTIVRKRRVFKTKQQ